MKVLSLFRTKPKEAPPSELDNLVMGERLKQAQAFIGASVPAFVQTWPIDIPRIVIILNYDDGESITVQIERPVFVPDGDQSE